MGGNVTLNALVAQPNLVDAAVIYASTSALAAQNWKQFYDDSDDRRSVNRKIDRTYGLPKDSPTFWRAASPKAYFDRVADPLLVHHGTADGTCPIAWSTDIVETLEEKGKDVTFYRYKGAGHTFEGATWQRSIERTSTSSTSTWTETGARLRGQSRSSRITWPEDASIHSSQSSPLATSTEASQTVRWSSRASSASVTSPSDTRFSAALIASLTVTSGRLPRCTTDRVSARSAVISPPESSCSSRPSSPTRTVTSHADPMSSSLDSSSTVLPATPVSAAFTAPRASSPAVADGRLDVAATVGDADASADLGTAEVGGVEVGGAIEMLDGAAVLESSSPAHAANGRTRAATPAASPTARRVDPGARETSDTRLLT